MIYAEWFASSKWQIIGTPSRSRFRQPSRRNESWISGLRRQRAKKYWVILELNTEGGFPRNAVDVRIVSRAFYEACDPVFYRNATFTLPAEYAYSTLIKAWPHPQIPVPLPLGARLRKLSVLITDTKWLLPILTHQNSNGTTRRILAFERAPYLEEICVQLLLLCHPLHAAYTGLPDWMRTEVLTFVHSCKYYGTTIQLRPPASGHIWCALHSLPGRRRPLRQDVIQMQSVQYVVDAGSERAAIDLLLHSLFLKADLEVDGTETFGSIVSLDPQHEEELITDVFPKAQRKIECGLWLSREPAAI